MTRNNKGRNGGDHPAPKTSYNDANHPRNRSWTRPMVRLIACLPRSNDAAGRGLQGGATKAGA